MSVTPPTSLNEQAAAIDKGSPARPRLAFLRSPGLRKPSTIIGLSILAVFVLIAIFAPLFAPYDPRTKTGGVFEPPSAAHWLGTDDSGADMLSLRHLRIARLADRRIRRCAGGDDHRRRRRALLGFPGGRVDEVFMRSPTTCW